MKPDSNSDRAVVPAADPASHPAGGAPASPTRSNNHPRLPRALVRGVWLMLTVYGLWLVWLAYVAWINVRAGNQ